MKTLKLYLLAPWLMIFPGIIFAQQSSTSNVIQKSSDCQAVFFITLDTLSALPFRYIMTDKSTGDIDSWSWDFGDGNTSSEKNPAHQYEGPGTYQVCLTVTNLSNPELCYHQFCQEITTREYFSLGGLVYAGDYPLNNPVPAGDTGIAYLYRSTGGQLLYMDDQRFQDFGYYGFGFLLPGSYVVKIALTKGSVDYNSYFPTYSGNWIKWQNASAFTITDESIYNAEIHLLPVSFVNSGTGIIRGQVKFERGYDMEPLQDSQITVILYDESQNPLYFTVPDPSGHFEFTGLPFRNYYLSADATGKPATLTMVTLTENNPLVDNINLTVFGPGVQGLPEDYADGISIARLYPNPVRNELNIHLNSRVRSVADIMITDVTGREFSSQSITILPGENHLSISVSGLPEGLYILRLQPHALQRHFTAKFVKKL